MEKFLASLCTSTVGLLLSTSIAMAEDSGASLIQTDEESGVDIYVLEDNFSQAMGQLSQTMGYFDHAAAIACEHTMSATHNIGIVGINRHVTDLLHGVEMPLGSRFTDTSDVESHLECIRTNTVPESWVGLSGGGDVRERLTVKFSDSIGHSFNSGNAAILVIQEDINGPAKTVYTRESSLNGTDEYSVSITEMVNPSAVGIDYMFVDGERLDADEEGFVILDTAQHLSFQ